MTKNIVMESPVLWRKVTLSSDIKFCRFNREMLLLKYIKGDWVYIVICNKK